MKSRPQNAFLPVLARLLCGFFVFVAVSCSSEPDRRSTQQAAGDTLVGSERLGPPDKVSPNAGLGRKDEVSALSLYLSLPENSLLPPQRWRPLTRAERLMLIRKRNLNTGYLQLQGVLDLAWEGQTDLAFFRHPSGTILAAINVAYCPTPDSCADDIYILEEVNFAWDDITRKAFGPLTPAELQARYKAAGGSRAAISLQDLGLFVPERGNLLRLFVREPAGKKTTVATFRYARGNFELLEAAPPTE